MAFVIRPQTRLEQRQQLRRVDGTGLTDLPESRGFKTLLSGSLSHGLELCLQLRGL